MGGTLASWDVDTERYLRRASTSHGRVELICVREYIGAKWLVWEVHATYRGDYGVSLFLTHAAARDEYYHVLACMLAMDKLRKPLSQWVRPSGMGAERRRERALVM